MASDSARAAARPFHHTAVASRDALPIACWCSSPRQVLNSPRREQPRELRPRRIGVTWIDVIGPLEAFDGFRDRRGPPPEIPDAPAHHEVDVLPAAGVGDDAAIRGGNLQVRWLLSSEWLAASSGHEGILSVRGYGGSIIIEDQYVLVMRIASRSSHPRLAEHLLSVQSESKEAR